MIGSLSDTPEHKQSMRMRPACDRVIREVWGPSATIVRFDRNDEEGPHVLDQNYHIDVQVGLVGGGTVTLQEKALTYRYSDHRTFTMEYHQNRHTGEEGEFFHIAAQYYLSGYSDETGIEFLYWNILAVAPFVEWYQQQQLELRPSTSRADFIYPSLLLIPSRICYRSGRGPGCTYSSGPICTWGPDA